MNVDIEILFGVALIVIYATERFNSPPSIRASTTAVRYYAATAIYMLIYLISFYIFTKYPRLLGLFRELFNIEFPKSANTTPILGALLLSLLVPKIPVISEIDTRLRRFLHRLAAIPIEAIRLSKEIQSSRYEVPPSLLGLVAQELEEQGFSRDIVESTDPIAQRWVCIVSLMIQLNRWDQSHQFAVFAQERSGQIQRIREHHARVAKMALTTFGLINHAKAQPESDALQGAADKFRINLQSEQEALLSEMCDFISGAILKTCFRCGSRQKMLIDMGFVGVENSSSAGLSVNQTILLFGLLLVLVLGNFILFRPPNAEGERLLLMITMIASIYSAAVICAVFPKLRWRTFKCEQSGSYPASGYLLAGIMAVIAGSVISVFFKTLIFASSTEITGFWLAFHKAWNQFSSDSYPWLTMAFVSAASVAFFVDWRYPLRFSSRSNRFIVGTLQAMLLTAAGFLVHWWISSLSASGGFHGEIPDLGLVLRTSAIVGFVLGFVVPTWYRGSRDKDVVNVADATSVGNRDVVKMPAQGAAIVKQLRSSL